MLFKSALKKHIKIDLVQRITWSTTFKSDNSGSIKIKRGCHMLRNTTLHADGGDIFIDRGTFINENVKIVAHDSIEIGKNCSIGPNVVIYDHDHNYKSVTSGFKTSAIVIEEDAWIGANSVILRGVHIGKGAVIAAGTVVTSSVPDKTLCYQKREVAFKKYKDCN